MSGVRIPTIDDVKSARERIAGSMHLTPIATSSIIERAIGCRLSFKCENLQKTGSFKSRGALNAVRCLSAEQQRAGVVTVSAGNHAQALAWAAASQKIACRVVMPAGATRSKVEASEGYGATVIFEESSAAAFERAQRIAREDGSTFVHPFDDANIIAGAGTVGLEMAEQLSDIETVVVPVGGGGLISGVLVALKALAPHAKIYGVEPAGAAVMYDSLAAGKPLRMATPPKTIADGLASPMAGELTYAVISTLSEGVVKIDDAAIADAMRLIITRTKLLVEPAGATALAAVMAGLIPGTTNSSVAVILSGGNVDLSRLQ